MPYLNLTLAMIIVGSSVVAGKIMVADIPVFLASALRFILALILLIPLVHFREEGLPRLSRRSWIMLALQALNGSFLFTVCLLYGLTLTSPASAGIITSTTPACMGIIAWLFLKDRLQLTTALGILLSVAGIMCINLLGVENGTTGSSPIWGNVLVLLAVVFESMFLLLRKTVPEPLSPLAASTIISLFGLVYFLPLGIYEAVHFDFLAASTTTWLTVAYYGVFVTVLAYLFWFAGIVKVRASVAGVFTGVMPVSALALSALILDEPLGLAHILGCIAVICGILLISWSGNRSKQRKRHQPMVKIQEPEHDPA
ncbi:MAG: DMT family transporter [Desulfovibrio sp.]|nr:MAG: DMT family transporter [Desulfovibrio sp.]